MPDRSRYDQRRREFRDRRPSHFCGNCTSVLFADDPVCLECDLPRPEDGWSSLQDTFDPCLGRVLADRYLVTRFVGLGGTGNVYRAESLTILRQFAIKFMDTQKEGTAGKQRIRARLEREIEALSRLRNPHIVPIYEVLELHGDFIGVVMDYIEGVTLETLVEEGGAMAADRAAHIVAQIANGVHEAHVAGMTHRDLKPENVMIERLPLGDEFAHVLDFGIVRLGDRVSVTPGFLGTPLYASPEQARGETVDQRSDIYSLGGILFFCLTGRPPFEGTNSYEVLDQHIRSAPPTLSEARPAGHFGPELEDLVARMLAKNADDRPQSMADVIDSLNQFRSRPVSPAPPEAFDRKAARSDRVLPVGPHQTRPGRPAARERPEETEPTETLRTPAPGSISPVAPDQAAPKAQPEATKSSPGAAILRRQTSGRARARRAAAKEAAEAASGATRTGTTGMRPLAPSPPRGVAQAQLLPDGGLVMVDKAHVVWLVRKDRPNRLEHVHRADHPVRALATGSDFAILGKADGSISRLDLRTGVSSVVFENIGAEQISAIGVDDQGTLVVVGTQSGRLLYGRLQYKRNPLTRVRSGNPVTGAVVSASGDYFAVAATSGDVTIHNINSPRSAFTHFTVEGRPDLMAFSLDGHILAVLTPAERSVLLHHVFTGHPLMRFAGSRGDLIGLRFAGNNELLGISEIQGGIYSWDLQKTMVPMPR